MWAMQEGYSATTFERYYGGSYVRIAGRILRIVALEGQFAVARDVEERFHYFHGSALQQQGVWSPDQWLGRCLTVGKSNDCMRAGILRRPAVKHRWQFGLTPSHTIGGMFISYDDADDILSGKADASGYRRAHNRIRNAGWSACAISTSFTLHPNPWKTGPPELLLHGEIAVGQAKNRWTVRLYDKHREVAALLRSELEGDVDIE